MDLMIDLETLSTDVNAAIVGLGACTFNLGNGEIDSTFGVSITIASNLKADRHLSAATIEWWLTQSDEARAALLTNCIPLTHAVSKFLEWAPVPGTTNRIWANDPSFDLVILTQTFKALNHMWPYGFWTYRSMRTIGELALPDKALRKATIDHFRKEGTHHSAVDDAVAQARFVSHCYQLLQRRAV